jgi:hypothetical protein
VSVMSNDSSLVGAFNLNTQAGVMSVLAAVRASQISPADKNDIRDLVFLYTNGGGDASVRIALEQKLAAHNIAPVVMQKSGAVAPVLPFGTYRPTPSFKAPAPVSAPTPIPNPVPVQAPVAPQPSVLPETPVAQPAPAPVPPVQPVAPIPQAMPVPAAPVIPPAPAQVVPPPVMPSPVPPPIPQPAPVPLVQPAPAATSVSGAPEAAYLERIRQIKTAVNSKVGNPVNLVDINNEIGREYMNALLEAMKKLGSGAVSEMGPAMQRLEATFAAVEVAIEKHQAGKTVSAPTPTPTSAPTPVAPSQPAAAPVPPSNPPAEPSYVVAAEVAPVVPAPAAITRPVPRPVVEEVAPVAPLPSRPAPEVSTPRVPIMDVPLPPRPIPQQSEPASIGPSGYDAVLPSPAPVAPTLADAAKARTPQDLPAAADVQTGAQGDTLFTKEVDDGLDQLLSDWSLFKKSGIFGTGPKGREHPLFKKLAGLQVPLLLAGRFDGATQEIRQSITDYMNGWRYEQGIIYQPGETFEKYLRRVIRHILNLQSKRGNA